MGDDIECQNRTHFSQFFLQYDYTGETSVFKTLSGTMWAKVAAYIVLIICGLVGNISVILTVALNRSLRTTINIYITNLAVADLMICIFCMIFECIEIMTRPSYALGPFMCKFNNYIQMVSLICSVFTLSAISCDRFVAILFPLHARVTKQRTSVVISGVWLTSILIAIPFLIVKRQDAIVWRNFEEKKCVEYWPMQLIYDPQTHQCKQYSILRIIYYTFATAILFFLPVLIMIIAYSLILWKLWVSEVPGEHTESNANVQDRARKKVIKMVTVVLVVFILCWLPQQILILYDQYSKKTGAIPEWLNSYTWVVYFTAYTNSVLNPLIYGGYNETFREELCLVLKCRCRRHTGPSFSQKSRTSQATSVTLNRPKALNGIRNQSLKSNNIEMGQIQDENNGDISQTIKQTCVGIDNVDTKEDLVYV